MRLRFQRCHSTHGYRCGADDLRTLNDSSQSGVAGESIITAQLRPSFEVNPQLRDGRSRERLIK